MLWTDKVTKEGSKQTSVRTVSRLVTYYKELTVYHFQAQMVRRVKAYLKNMKVITDEEKLLAMSMECEPPSGGIQIAQPSVGNDDFLSHSYHTLVKRKSTSL